MQDTLMLARALGPAHSAKRARRLGILYTRKEGSLLISIVAP